MKVQQAGEALAFLHNAAPWLSLQTQILKEAKQARGKLDVQVIFVYLLFHSSLVRKSKSLNHLFENTALWKCFWVCSFTLFGTCFTSLQLEDTYAQIYASHEKAVFFRYSFLWWLQVRLTRVVSTILRFLCSIQNSVLQRIFSSDPKKLHRPKENWDEEGNRECRPIFPIPTRKYCERIRCISVVVEVNKS